MCTKLKSDDPFSNSMLSIQLKCRAVVVESGTTIDALGRGWS